MSEEIHGRHLEHLSDIIAGRTSPLTELVFDLLKFYGVFQGATSLKGGSDGFVPAPAAGDEVKFLCGDGTWRAIPSGKVILNNIPATVNGGMWYEVEYGMPAVKIYYNGQKYPVGMSRDPDLTVTLTSSATVTAASPATATVSYEGGGNISITTNPEVEFTYENGIITIPYADVSGAITVTVRLSSSAGFKGASKSFAVTMQKLPSNLRVTPTATTIPADSYINATAQYDDPKAQITVTSSDSKVVTVYSNKRITVRYASGVTSATITVTLTASAGYTNETKTFTVTMERLSPNLTLNQTEFFTVRKDVIVPVSRRGNGEITVTETSGMHTPSEGFQYSNGVITVPWCGVNNTRLTYAVTVAADGVYDEMTAYFTIMYCLLPVVDLPFDKSVTEDLGQDLTTTTTATWEKYGAPFIYELDAWAERHPKCAGFYTKPDVINGLVRTPTLGLGGTHDFTIRFWFYHHPNSGAWARIFELIPDENDGTAKGAIFFGRHNESNDFFLRVGDADRWITAGNYTWYHFELVYQHDIQKATCYIQGRHKASITGEIAYVQRKLRIGYSVWSADQDLDRTKFRYTAGAFCGYIDDFQIYRDVALHTSDFDPAQEI